MPRSIIKFINFKKKSKRPIIWNELSTHEWNKKHNAVTFKLLIFNNATCRSKICSISVT